MSRPSSHRTIYRIETRRLIVRCWQPADASALCDAIACSVEQLRPWLPWAHREPETPDAKARRIVEWRSKFDRGEDFLFGIFDRTDETRVLGGTGFHPRIGAGACEIGYWIRSDYAGKGFITEAAGALTRLGFECDGLARIEIHCDPKNFGSAAIPAKLGYRLALTMLNRVYDPTIGPRDTSMFVLTRRDYAASAAANIEADAFDVSGNRIDRQLLSS